jgi:hypothetical protein
MLPNEFAADSPLEGDGFELPVPREIAEACRRHEQTVAILRPGDHRKVMDHLWGPTSGARSMATYGANGFPAIKAIISAPAIPGRLAQWTPKS